MQIQNFTNEYNNGNLVITENSQYYSASVKRDVRIRSKFTFGIMKEIYDKKGSRALFAGLVPRVTKVSFACAVMIASYEYCKIFFEKVHITQRLRYN